MRSSILLGSLLSLVLSVSSASAAGEVLRYAKRTYTTHDYYVLEHDPMLGVSVQECADALGVEVIEPAGELPNHWLLRAQKSGSDAEDRVVDERMRLADILSLDKRDTLPLAIKHLARQIPRQRVKRAPAPPPIPPEDSDPKPLSRAIAERLGIEDPMFKDQWHLVNEDYPEHMMNATPVWDMGITGKGIISCMVDDGLDFESEDLADNFVSCIV